MTKKAPGILPFKMKVSVQNVIFINYPTDDYPKEFAKIVPRYSQLIYRFIYTLLDIVCSTVLLRTTVSKRAGRNVLLCTGIVILYVKVMDMFTNAVTYNPNDTIFLLSDSNLST